MSLNACVASFHCSLSARLSASSASFSFAAWFASVSWYRVCSQSRTSDTGFSKSPSALVLCTYSFTAATLSASFSLSSAAIHSISSSFTRDVTASNFSCNVFITTSPFSGVMVAIVRSFILLFADSTRLPSSSSLNNSFPAKDCSFHHDKRSTLSSCDIMIPGF